METGFQSLFDGYLDVDPAQEAHDLLKSLPSGKGILLFADVADHPIQLLSTASMRAAATARLAPRQQVAHSKRADLSSVIARIYYVSTFCELRSILRYRDISVLLYPWEYRRMMNLGRLSVVQIDMAAQWPCFSVSQRVFWSSAIRSFGPFPTHKSAVAFAAALNHAFLLCRETALAADPRKALSCPYLQMKTCPAPCVDQSQAHDYRRRVADAVMAASGQHQAVAETFRERMSCFASERRFEEANQVKLSLNAIHLLKEPPYRWTTDLVKLTILHIDRSRKVRAAESRKLVQSYSIFILRPGRIEKIFDVTLAELSAALAKMPATPAAGAYPAEPFLTDSLSIIQSLLYRSNPPGIMLDLTKPLSPPDVLSKLEARFSRSDTPSDSSDPRQIY